MRSGVAKNCPLARWRGRGSVIVGVVELVFLNKRSHNVGRSQEIGSGIDKIKRACDSREQAGYSDFWPSGQKSWYWSSLQGAPSRHMFHSLTLATFIHCTLNTHTTPAKFFDVSATKTHSRQFEGQRLPAELYAKVHNIVRTSPAVANPRRSDLETEKGNKKCSAFSSSKRFFWWSSSSSAPALISTASFPPG